ncbi:hypothetical protein IGI04_013903 [Brassica rapa subsp. trilocularis]|uniref:Uncharacterized protein n=1 Tax=Brassica rapa subsp. trilocularis TaxID=1813537 RepID=A0ABQ7NA60_BRACM|nr:hypothetical protein IGI04_013903 [Brassica rapa subsp. trilocularis]
MNCTAAAAHEVYVPSVIRSSADEEEEVQCLNSFCRKRPTSYGLLIDAAVDIVEQSNRQFLVIVVDGHLKFRGREVWIWPRENSVNKRRQLSTPFLTREANSPEFFSRRSSYVDCFNQCRRRAMGRHEEVTLS